jgi:Tol biopolymer transport system component
LQGAPFLIEPNVPHHGSLRLTNLIDMTQSVKSLSASPISFPALSSDGSECLYAEYANQLQSQVYLVNFINSTCRLSVEGSNASVSPNRAYVAFSRSDQELYLVNLDRSKVERVAWTFPRLHADYLPYTFSLVPAWSVDGNWLVFALPNWNLESKDSAPYACTHKAKYEGLSVFLLDMAAMIVFPLQDGILSWVWNRKASALYH